MDKPSPSDIADNLRASTEDMASFAVVDMCLWDRHSNACLKAADEIERLRALTAPQLNQHGGGVEAALRAALEPFAQYPTADGLPNGLLRIDDEHPILFFGQEVIATVGDFRRARAALAQQPLSAPAWQPIETAPKDGTRILVADARGHIEVGACGNTMRKKQEWRAEYQLGRVLYPQPLYWMPMPAAPAHPTQCDVSCSRAREGGTGE